MGEDSEADAQHDERGHHERLARLREELHEAREDAHHARVLLLEAAIEAEIETGRHEETFEEARTSLIKRAARIGAGSFILLLGLLMLALPGPGLVTVVAGLAILAVDVPFAARLLERVRQRLPEDEEGNVSKPLIVGSILFAVLVTGVSLWFTFA